MQRPIRLTAGLLALSVLPLDAIAQTAAPAPAAEVRLQPPDSGDNTATALAKKLQNPVGDLYSFPFQNNTNFNYGPHKGTQDILNVQPVIPIHVNEDWNIITRTILPLVWQPSLQPAQTVPFGTGPITFSVFLSPRNPTNGWLWAVGPVLQVPHRYRGAAIADRLSPHTRFQRHLLLRCPSRDTATVGNAGARHGCSMAEP